MLSLQCYWAILEVVWCDCLLAFFGDRGFINLRWIPNVHFHPRFNAHVHRQGICKSAQFRCELQILRSAWRKKTLPENICGYLFSPGVWFLMFAEETRIPFCGESLNAYICYQWLLCLLFPGAFREDVARGSTGNSTERQNDESEMRMGLPSWFLSWNSTAKGKEGGDCAYNRAEREMSSMKNPSSLRAECRKIIENINETFKNHRHSNVFFKWKWFNQSPVEIPTRLPGRNFSQLFHARCRCGNVLLSCLTNFFSLQNQG